MPAEKPDRTEATLQIEPIENAEAKLPRQPQEPIEANDPAEPMDRMEPAEPIDRIDPVEPMERIDPFEPIERIELPSPPGPGEPSVAMITLWHPHGRSGTAGRELEGGLAGRELPGRQGARAAQEPVPE